MPLLSLVYISNSRLAISGGIAVAPQHVEGKEASVGACDGRPQHLCVCVTFSLMSYLVVRSDGVVVMMRSINAGHEVRPERVGVCTRLCPGFQGEARHPARRARQQR